MKAGLKFAVTARMVQFVTWVGTNGMPRYSAVRNMEMFVSLMVELVNKNSVIY